MTKDEALAALPNMSQDDLRAIITVASSLLGDHTGGFNSPAIMTAALMFEALSTALNVNLPYAKVAGSKWGRLFDEKVPVLAHWLTDHFTGWDRNRVSTMAFLRMLFELNVNDLRQREITVSFGTAVQNFDRMPKIFEDAFPGYIENRLGELVLKMFR